jgi:hypothetical protein
MRRSFCFKLELNRQKIDPLPPSSPPTTRFFLQGGDASAPTTTAADENTQDPALLGEHQQGEELRDFAISECGGDFILARKRLHEEKLAEAASEGKVCVRCIGEFKTTIMIDDSDWTVQDLLNSFVIDQGLPDQMRERLSLKHKTKVLKLETKIADLDLQMNDEIEVSFRQVGGGKKEKKRKIFEDFDEKQSSSKRLANTLRDICHKKDVDIEGKAAELSKEERESALKILKPMWTSLKAEYEQVQADSQAGGGGTTAGGAAPAAGGGGAALEKLNRSQHMEWLIDECVKKALSIKRNAGIAQVNCSKPASLTVTPGIKYDELVYEMRGHQEAISGGDVMANLHRYPLGMKVDFLHRYSQPGMPWAHFDVGQSVWSAAQYLQTQENKTFQAFSIGSLLKYHDYYNLIACYPSLLFVDDVYSTFQKERKLFRTALAKAVKGNAQAAQALMQSIDRIKFEDGTSTTIDGMIAVPIEFEYEIKETVAQLLEEIQESSPDLQDDLLTELIEREKHQELYDAELDTVVVVLETAICSSEFALLDQYPVTLDRRYTSTVCVPHVHIKCKRNTL